jgi:RNA polymerase sigma-70 factor, ECF subfamily
MAGERSRRAERKDGGRVAVRRVPVNNAGAGGSHEPPDANSLQTLYEQHLTAIYRFIYSKVGNREEAEDLTSQVFLKAVRGLDRSRDAASMLSWLFQVARTTVADHWRSFYQLPARSLDDLLDTGWEGPLQGAPVSNSSSSGQRVQSILAQLPQRYREVLTYRFLLNYSVRETAARMGLSEANVKVLQFRALKKSAEIEQRGASASAPPASWSDECDQR